jgi:alkanesulfonate monooxygenase SsuD/methylene tetrahydromethanopterin reductase-like flavin-dependent oxidoreductase (luciferase family)
MKFGLDVATTGDWSDPRRLTALAVDAEQAGWDGFFVWDIFLADDDAVPVADPWIALALIASATSRIRIGALVTPLPRRQAWEVARQTATLDVLSDGRVTFGAGLGWREAEFERLGLPSDRRTRARQLDESLYLVDRFWSGEPTSLNGDYYRIDSVQLLPRPVQRPRIPVWLATGWPHVAPLRRAIGWDGAYLMTQHQGTNLRIAPDDVREVAALVAAERSSLEPFDIAVNVFTLEEPDDGVAITAAMASAGATWTIELTPPTFEEHRDLVRRGPPRFGSVR